jgi:PST family polysaccharide transporter
VPFTKLAGALVRPILACGPLVGGVLLARRGLQGLGGVPPVVALLVEVTVGMVAYIPSAFLFAGAASRELVRHALDTLRRRQSRGAEV